MPPAYVLHLEQLHRYVRKVLDTGPYLSGLWLVPESRISPRGPSEPVLGLPICIDVTPVVQGSKNRVYWRELEIWGDWEGRKTGPGVM